MVENGCNFHAEEKKKQNYNQRLIIAPIIMIVSILLKIRKEMFEFTTKHGFTFIWK